MNRCPDKFNDVWMDNCTCSAGQLVRSLRVCIFNGKCGKSWSKWGWAFGGVLRVTTCVPHMWVLCFIYLFYNLPGLLVHTVCFLVFLHYARTLAGL